MVTGTVSVKLSVSVVFSSVSLLVYDVDEGAEDKVVVVNANLVVVDFVVVVVVDFVVVI